MMIKAPKNYYRWQPELPLSIIFWSLTFGTFFLSIIACLELNHINLIAIGIFCIFCFLTLWGIQRYFIIRNNQLQIKALLPQNRCVIQIAAIEKVSIGAYGLTIYFAAKENREPFVVLMRKNTLSLFIECLNQHAEFSGAIEEVCNQVN